MMLSSTCFSKSIDETLFKCVSHDQVQTHQISHSLAAQLKRKQLGALIIVRMR